MEENLQLFWHQFKVARPEYKSVTVGSAWSFGDSKEMADQLAKLVLSGEKTATASAKVEYEVNNEPLPEVEANRVDIVLDGSNQPVAIIRNTHVYLIPFNEVTASHAYKEGEGDKSLDYWRKEHREFWTRSFKEQAIFGVDIDTMDVVCEEFEVLWAK